MLRVSLSNVARRIREYGLVNLLPYSTISEEDLDGVVRDVQALFPNIGYRRMLGELTRRGIVIQHARVRASMIRTDPYLDGWILYKDNPTVFMGQMPCGILMGTTN